MIREPESPLWFIYCLSEDGRWVMLAARKRKSEAEQVAKRLEENYRTKCKVLLGEI